MSDTFESFEKRPANPGIYNLTNENLDALMISLCRGVHLASEGATHAVEARPVEQGAAGPLLQRGILDPGRLQ